MGSIDISSFTNLSPANFMIKIWEFSEHVHHKPPPDLSSCNCQFYLRCCIEAAREVWDNENYIFFGSALYRFQFHRKKYLCIMSTKNDHYREYLVESILREEREFFFLRNETNATVIQPKMKQTRLFNLPVTYIDDLSLNLRNLSDLEKYAITKKVWDGYYLISRFKGRENVFPWYKQLQENRPFWYFLNQCSFDADEIDNRIEPVWVGKLFEKIKTVCFQTDFFYKLFWIIVSNQLQLRRIINNYRRHQYAKRLFEKI